MTAKKNCTRRRQIRNSVLAPTSQYSSIKSTLPDAIPVGPPEQTLNEEPDVSQQTKRRRAWTTTTTKINGNVTGCNEYRICREEIARRKIRGRNPHRIAWNREKCDNPNPGPINDDATDVHVTWMECSFSKYMEIKNCGSMTVCVEFNGDCEYITRWAIWTTSAIEACWIEKVFSSVNHQEQNESGHKRALR